VGNQKVSCLSATLGGLDPGRLTTTSRHTARQAAFLSRFRSYVSPLTDGIERTDGRFTVNAPPEKANARRQPSERVNELADTTRLRARPYDVNATYGPPELCTWSVGPGTCRFQTDQPCIARKVSQRSGAQLVAYSVHGGYLRIFQEKISPRSARKLVTRYLKGIRESRQSEIKATNTRFSALQSPPASRKSPGGCGKGTVK
jgi:hypothetical protein